MADREVIEVVTPAGGWLNPWPNVAEIEQVLSKDKWTLIGGLMTQLHAIHRGIDAVRPTIDIDMVVHVETSRGVVIQTAMALESLGYSFTPSIDERERTGHRFTRGPSTIDVAIPRSRLLTLREALPGEAPEWRQLPGEWRARGQAALRILTA